jgi:hypothetical protein
VAPTRNWVNVIQLTRKCIYNIQNSKIHQLQFFFCKIVLEMRAEKQSMDLFWRILIYNAKRIQGGYPVEPPSKVPWFLLNKYKHIHV